jgi:FkbM family methyltransferase
MRLDELRARGVSVGRLRSLTNPARFVLWRLLLPWFETMARDFGAMTYSLQQIQEMLEEQRQDTRKSIEQALERSLEQARQSGQALAQSSLSSLSSRLEGVRIDQRAVAYRLGSIEERLATAFPDAPADDTLRHWLEGHQSWLERLAAESAALGRRIDELDALPVRHHAEDFPVVSARSGRFLVPPNDLIGRRLRRGEEWEPHVSRAIDEHADPTGTAIDVGAYIGLHTVHLSTVFRRVLAFEPQHEIFRILCANLALNACARVDIFERALYDHPCTLRLAPDESQDTAVPRRNGRIDYDLIRNAASLAFELASDSGDGVEATTIDAFALDDVRFIKVDAQGADLRVLHGAATTIERCRPVIAFEHERDLAIRFGDTFDDFRAFFAARNYELRVLATQREGAQADYLALPR